MTLEVGPVSDQDPGRDSWDVGGVGGEVKGVVGRGLRSRGGRVLVGMSGKKGIYLKESFGPN